MPSNARPVLFLMAATFIQTAMPLGAQAPREITLPAGTALSVRLGQSLDTKRDRPGAPFVAHLASPLMHDGQVVLPRGTLCRGHLVESKPSGRLKGRAVMSMSLDSLELNGKSYTISTSRTARVSSAHRNRNLALIGGGAGTGAAIGAIAGGGVGALVGAGAGAAAGTTGAVITGKRNIHLPAESRLHFALREPVTVRK